MDNVFQEIFDVHKNMVLNVNIYVKWRLIRLKSLTTSCSSSADFYTNKSNSHNVPEILLKVALNTHVYIWKTKKYTFGMIPKFSRKRQNWYP